MSWGTTLTGLSALTESLKDARNRWVGSKRWVVGTNVEYSAYVEFGTARQQAQPYLFPAVRHVMRNEADEIARKSDSTEELVERLALAIEREAKERVPVDTGNLKASIRAEEGL